MYIPRSLEKGPEYQDSVEACRQKGFAKFKQNLATACNVAKFEPEAATQVCDSNLRIAQVYDAVSGYSLALYFEGTLTGDAATLIQVEVFDLEPDFAPW